MKLTVLGSSSSGNCYVIQSEDEALILEAGISLLEVKSVLNYDTTKVAGVLCTHSHGDHSKYAKEFEDCFPFYTHKSVIVERRLQRAKVIEAEKGFIVGKFKVYPFEAYHDVPCLGFLIYHDKFGSLMFLTDSYKCNYTFENLNHIMIECNYTDRLIDENVEIGLLHPYVGRRTKKTHMSLETCKLALKNQNLEKVHNILLIHLSSQNSDPNMFYDVIAKATGKPIKIAKPGVEIELVKNPY